MVIVDSACEVHLTDPSVVRQCGQNMTTPKVPLQIIAAGGTQLEHKGSAQIQFELAESNDAICDFQVAEIGKTILSVAQMVDKGYVVEFGPD